MAGGINLPFNIGVGPVQGPMDFRPNQEDPFTTMLRTYALGQQGQRYGMENAMAAEELPYAGEKARLGMDKLEAEIANLPIDAEYKRAMIERSRVVNNQPNYSAGVAGQLEWIRNAREQGRHEEADKAQQALDSLINQREGTDISRIPKEERLRMTSIAKAMNIDPMELFERLKRGETMEQMAESKNISPEEFKTITGYYPPTTATLGKIEQRAGTDAELEYLSDLRTKWLKPYKDKVSDLTGVSAKYVADLMSGKNQKEREQLIASYILALDVPAGQLRLASIEGGITALQQQMDHSLANIKPILSGVDPDSWAGGTKLAMDALSAGNTIYFDVASNPGPFIEGRKKKFNIKSGVVGDEEGLTKSMASTEKPIGEMSLEEVNAAIEAEKRKNR